MTGDGRLAGHKIAVLIESDFYEKEIFYYGYRFPEEGAEVHFLTRLWGQPALTFTGHEYKAPLVCDRSFENMDDETLRSYSAVIVPSGIVSDRLRFTEKLADLPPAEVFLRRAFNEPSIVKGLWLVSRTPELVRGRDLVCHTNLYGDAINMGANFVDSDVVIDGDLVTARSGAQAGLFAHTLIDRIAARTPQPVGA
jgi:protease I